MNTEKTNYFFDKFGASMFEETCPEIFWRVIVLIYIETDSIATSFNFILLKLSNEQIKSKHLFWI